MQPVAPVSLLSGLVVFGEAAVGLDTCHRDTLSLLGKHTGDGGEMESVTPVRTR